MSPHFDPPELGRSVEPPEAGRSSTFSRSGSCQPDPDPGRERLHAAVRDIETAGFVGPFLAVLLFIAGVLLVWWLS